MRVFVLMFTFARGWPTCSLFLSCCFTSCFLYQSPRFLCVFPVVSKGGPGRPAKKLKRGNTAANTGDAGRGQGRAKDDNAGAETDGRRNGKWLDRTLVPHHLLLPNFCFRYVCPFRRVCAIFSPTLTISAICTHPIQAIVVVAAARTAQSTTTAAAMRLAVDPARGSWWGRKTVRYSDHWRLPLRLFSWSESCTLVSENALEYTFL